MKQPSRWRIALLVPYYFLIGALVGWLYGKIKNKTIAQPML
jgi:ABC-type uncharacterized transport system permease subunit